MKTLFEIFDEQSAERGYKSIDDVINKASQTTVYFVMKRSAEEYAKQVAEVQREACAENATTKDDPRDYGKYEIGQIVDKDSILNTPLVTDNI